MNNEYLNLRGGERPAGRGVGVGRGHGGGGGTWVLTGYPLPNGRPEQKGSMSNLGAVNSFFW